MLIIICIIVLIVYILLGKRSIKMYMDSLPQVKVVNNKCIVSLTTIPSRTSKILPTIYSLLDQTVPLEIQIHVPIKANCEPNKVYTFPESVLSNKNIKIITHPVDTGPSMKFIPAINSENKHIIVVDDDMVYPPEMNEVFLAQVNRNPYNVYTTRGHVFQENKSFASLLTKFSNRVDTPLQVSIITGCGGYIISNVICTQLRGIIDDYSNAPKEAKLMDDIWISGVLNNLGIKKYVIPGISRYINSIFSFLLTTAHLSNGRVEKNNIVINHFTWIEN